MTFLALTVVVWAATGTSASTTTAQKAKPAQGPTDAQINQARKKANRCMRDFGVRPFLVSKARPMGAAYRKWVLRLWQERYATCRLLYIETRSLQSSTSDWATAVRLAQKPFPGTASWLLSCSASEGSHGAFVMNRQGSGAGGWMQFMSGTFYGYVDRAFTDARRRGYHVPTRHRSWTSPMGQALTAGYMRYHHLDRGHWYGSGC